MKCLIFGYFPKKHQFRFQSFAQLHFPQLASERQWPHPTSTNSFFTGSSEDTAAHPSLITHYNTVDRLDCPHWASVWQLLAATWEQNHC